MPPGLHVCVEGCERGASASPQAHAPVSAHQHSQLSPQPHSVSQHSCPSAAPAAHCARRSPFTLCSTGRTSRWTTPPHASVHPKPARPCIRLRPLTVHFRIHGCLNTPFMSKHTLSSKSLHPCRQAREFNDAVRLSGLILTKLDGTARGGASRQRGRRGHTVGQHRGPSSILCAGRLGFLVLAAVNCSTTAVTVRHVVQPVRYHGTWGVWQRSGSGSGWTAVLRHVPFPLARCGVCGGYPGAAGLSGGQPLRTSYRTEPALVVFQSVCHNTLHASSPCASAEVSAVDTLPLPSVPASQRKSWATECRALNPPPFLLCGYPRHSPAQAPLCRLWTRWGCPH